MTTMPSPLTNQPQNQPQNPLTSQPQNQPQNRQENQPQNRQKNQPQNQPIPATWSRGSISMPPSRPT